MSTPLPLEDALAIDDTQALPPIRDAYHLINEGFELPDEIIKGVLHRGCKMVVGGGSKSYKTWVLTELAMSVAHGQPWLGIPTMKIKVLYVNLEIQEMFYSDRIRKVRDAKGLIFEESQFLVWNLRGRVQGIEELATRIIKESEMHGFELIVIDPIYKCFSGADENSAGDIARLLGQLDRIAESTGAAVVFGAHFTKGNQANKESMDRISGSGVFARDPDAIITITKHREDGCYVVESVLRNCPPMPAFGIRWSHPLMKPDQELDPKDLKKLSGGREPQYSAHEIADVMGTGPMTRKTLWTRYKDEICGSPATFTRYLLDAVKIGLVVKDPETGLYSKNT